MILNQSQPCNLLAEKLRGEALAMLRENQVGRKVKFTKAILCQVSSQTAPSAEAGQDGGHNDSSLLI